jgi:peptide/nickel transport system substrate-binding protein
MPKSFFTLSIAIVFLLSFLLVSTGCGTRDATNVTIALSEKFSGLDTLSNTGTDAAADRIRNLLFNSLVKKNENFAYVGELADSIDISDDGLSITFRLKEGVKFHDGRTLKSSDVKYTLEALFDSGGTKAGSFFDSFPDPSDPEKKRRIRTAHITSVATPDDSTIAMTVVRPALVNQTLSNLVTIPIIPEGSIEIQKTNPIGSGPFKFVSFDQVNSIVRFSAFEDYWEGAPKIKNVTVKTVTDANALQAELQSGSVDVAPLPINLSPDTLKALESNPGLNVGYFKGSNIQYLGFNTENRPLNDPRIRQAIAYAIDRGTIIKELLSGQATSASSILPENSWAYSKGENYSFDVEKAKRLINDAGYKGELIKFKFSAGNAAVSQYSQVIQNYLKKVGLNVEIEMVDFNTLITQLAQGQFQMTTARWVGGNQDPIFLKDLFASTDFPDKKEGGRNRSRYSNPEFDRIIEDAVNNRDKDIQRQLYAEAQLIVSRDLPLLPLWYPSNVIVSRKRIGNVKINASGDWSFVKDLTLQ